MSARNHANFGFGAGRHVTRHNHFGRNQNSSHQLGGPIQWRQRGPNELINGERPGGVLIPNIGRLYAEDFPNLNAGRLGLQRGFGALTGGHHERIKEAMNAQLQMQQFQVLQLQQLLLQQQLLLMQQAQQQNKGEEEGGEDEGEGEGKKGGKKKKKMEKKEEKEEKGSTKAKSSGVKLIPMGQGMGQGMPPHIQAAVQKFIAAQQGDGANLSGGMAALQNAQLGQGVPIGNNLLGGFGGAGLGGVGQGVPIGNNLIQGWRGGGGQQHPLQNLQLGQGIPIANNILAALGGGGLGGGGLRGGGNPNNPAVNFGLHINGKLQEKKWLKLDPNAEEGTRISQMDIPSKLPPRRVFKSLGPGPGGNSTRPGLGGGIQGGGLGFRRGGKPNDPAGNF